MQCGFKSYIPYQNYSTERFVCEFDDVLTKVKNENLINGDMKINTLEQSRVLDS